ncbi:MAG: O-antigen ligase family protein [Erythrobacter sp.]|nr:O-antigen ligase family protein [Erythrobacter sp.]
MALIALLTIALLLGGGGQRYALANLCVQLAALGLLALHPSPAIGFWRSSPLALRILVAFSMLLPLAQIIPLPEAIWAALPGRELIAQGLNEADQSGWRPISLFPHRTLLAFTGLIVPVTILMAGWSLRRDQLIVLAWAIVAFGLVNLFLGAVQIASAAYPTLWVHDELDVDFMVGTFANRNSTGVFLVGALGFAALAPVPMERPHPAVLPLRLMACVLIVLAIVLTQSRTSLVLCAIPLALGGVRIIAWGFARGRPHSAAHPRARPAVLAGAALALAALVLIGLILAAPGRIAQTVDRFDNLADDARAYIWEDAGYAVSRYWPVGAGMGTFDEVFQLDEALENITERRAGRAHNDYLEVAIEAGIAGLAVAAAWLLLIAWFAWRARSARLRWLAWGAGAFLLAAALQSITDYPFRNQTNLAIGALCVLILARLAARSESKNP